MSLRPSASLPRWEQERCRPILPSTQEAHSRHRVGHSQSVHFLLPVGLWHLPTPEDVTTHSSLFSSPQNATAQAKGLEREQQLLESMQQMNPGDALSNKMLGMVEEIMAENRSELQELRRNHIELLRPLYGEGSAQDLAAAVEKLAGLQEALAVAAKEGPQLEEDLIFDPVFESREHAGEHLCLSFECRTSSRLGTISMSLALSQGVNSTGVGLMACGPGARLLVVA